MARRTLDLLRARPGARVVQFTPDAVRGGNLLYYWQWAYLGQAIGQRRSVLTTDHMKSWLDEFPPLKELTVSRADVGLFDQRSFDTRHHYGVSFTADENRRFSQWLINGSSSFRLRLERAREIVTERTCVVNVRRGDYYSVPGLRAEFGMDIRGHTAQAIEILLDLGRSADDVLIVSDDPEWCRENLSDVLPGGFRLLPRRRDLFDDLAALAASRTLVLANSTFSYWGSFLGSTLRDDHLAVAPAFHQKPNGGAVVDVLLDPSWKRTRPTTREDEAD